MVFPGWFVSYTLACGVRDATVGYLLLRDYATHGWSLCHNSAAVS